MDEALFDLSSHRGLPPSCWPAALSARPGARTLPSRAVSRTIGLLELRLGYALFEWRGRRFVPTAEAEALYREIEHVYSGIERIAHVAQDIRL